MGEPYSLNMIYATIFLALILILCIARIYFLNSEVKELEIAAGKLSNRIDQWSSGTEKGGVAVTHEMPKEIQEAQTELEWATNARDSKKESRTIWLGASAMALIALVAAIIELSQNSY
jgi:hypothetical protein